MVWRLDKDVAGSGALGDLGAHVIDLARYLVGEIDVGQRAHAHVRQGPRGPGRHRRRRRRVGRGLRERRGRHDRGHALRVRAARTRCTFEINGSKGSLSFDIERLNELEVHYRDSTPGQARPGLPHRARVRGRPSLLGALVAAGAHDRLGAHLRPRDPPLPDARSATTRTSRRTARRSRTATAPPRSATRCCARADAAAARPSTYRS